MISDYLEVALSGLSITNIAENIDALVEEKQLATKFDAIAIRGVSGALIGGVAASRLKKNLIVVRKRNDNHHSQYLVEGDLSANNYIIVDDMIATGQTIAAIVQEINDNDDDQHPKCLGIILYKNEYMDLHHMTKIAKQHKCWIASAFGSWWVDPL